ncbi:MAG: ABC transporter permease [Actinomycetota bacterium]|nr:ABC transporter permease [Actinomycetota bacterium]
MSPLSEAFHLLTHLDPYMISVIAVSFKVSAASLALSMLVGLPVGIALGTTRFAGRLGFLILVNSAIGLPPVVVGLVTFLALRSGGVFGSAGLLYTPTAMVIAQVPLAVPLIAGITMAAVSSLPRGLILQTRAFGANRIQQIAAIVRHSRSSLVAACVAGFAATISEVGAILITGGNLLIGGRNYTRTMTTAIVLETRLGNFARALAFGIILIAIIVVVNIILTRIQVGKPQR